MENTGLGTYTLISKWGFPKTYRGKIMLVAFLGTHAPLLRRGPLSPARLLGRFGGSLAYTGAPDGGYPRAGAQSHCWPWARCSPQ